MTMHQRNDCVSLVKSQISQSPLILPEASKLQTNSPEVHPDLFALQVRFQTRFRTSSKVGDVQSIDGNPKLLRQQLQSHLTGQVLQRKNNKETFERFPLTHPAEAVVFRAAGTLK